MQSICNVYVKHFSGARTKCLLETITTGRPGPFYFRCRGKRFKYRKVTWTNSKIDYRSDNSVKKWLPRCKSNIVRSSNTKPKEKGCEVKFLLKEMCKERNMHLVDHSKKIKPFHFSWAKLHLKQKWSKVQGGVFWNKYPTFLIYTVSPKFQLLLKKNLTGFCPSEYKIR